MSVQISDAEQSGTIGSARKVFCTVIMDLEAPPGGKDSSR